MQVCLACPVIETKVSCKSETREGNSRKTNIFDWLNHKKIKSDTGYLVNGLILFICFIVKFIHEIPVTVYLEYYRYQHIKIINKFYFIVLNANWFIALLKYLHFVSMGFPSQYYGLNCNQPFHPYNLTLFLEWLIIFQQLNSDEL